MPDLTPEELRSEAQRFRDYGTLHGDPIARDCGQEADDLEAWAEEVESEAVLMRATTEGNARAPGVSRAA